MKLFRTTFHTIQLQPNQWFVVETFHILSFSLWCQLYGDESSESGEEGFLYEHEAQRKKRELQKRKLNGTL